MKKYLFLILSAILFSINTNAHDVKVSQFEKVFVNIPAKIKVIESNIYGVRVCTTDTVVSNSIKIDVENNTLKINVKPNIDLTNEDGIRIYISAPSIPSFNVGNNYNILELANKEKENEEV